MQTADDRVVTRDELKVVTKLAPTEAQFADLLFAWQRGQVRQVQRHRLCEGPRAPSASAPGR